MLGIDEVSYPHCTLFPWDTEGEIWGEHISCWLENAAASKRCGIVLFDRSTASLGNAIRLNKTFQT